MIVYIYQHKMGIVYLLTFGKLGYVGSTMETMKERMKLHHKAYKRWLNGNESNCGSYNIIKNEGYEILIIEEIENETKQECKQREQFWLDFYSEFGKLENKIYACGNDMEKKRKTTQKCNAEYYQKHREELKEYYQKNKEKIAEYYQKNKEKNKEKKTEYYQKNKEKIIKRVKELYHLKKLSLLTLNDDGKQD